MDNASFHHTPRIEEMCTTSGVKLLYLPPYSPDFNPIEEFFAELKGFIKRNWSVFTHDPERDFHSFLTWCVNTVGSKQPSAEGHFRHAGMPVEPPPFSRIAHEHYDVVNFLSRNELVDHELVDHEPWRSI